MTRKGLTAQAVAKQMFHRAWSLFGVPSVITSDQGPQFAAAWWRTLCGCLGLRTAFAQAYHSQANGRAEAARRELNRKLRYRLDEATGLFWVEALPIAGQKINDSPGESGISPYEIVTGRHLNLVGVPLPVEHKAQDALESFKRKKELDIKKWQPPLMSNTNVSQNVLMPQSKNPKNLTGEISFGFCDPLSDGRQGFAEVGRPMLHQGEMWPAQLYHRDTARGGATCAPGPTQAFSLGQPRRH